MSLLLDALKQAAEAKKSAHSPSRPSEPASGEVSQRLPEQETLHREASQDQSSPSPSSEDTPPPSDWELTLEPVESSEDQTAASVETLLDPPEATDYPPLSTKADLPLLSDTPQEADAQNTTTKHSLSASTPDHSKRSPDENRVTDEQITLSEPGNTPDNDAEKTTHPLDSETDPNSEKPLSQREQEIASDTVSRKTSPSAERPDQENHSFPDKEAATPPVSSSSSSEDTLTPPPVASSSPSEDKSTPPPAPPPMPGKHKKGNKSRIYLLLILLFLVAGTLGVGGAWYYYQIKVDDQANQLTRLSRPPLTIVEIPPESDETGTLQTHDDRLIGEESADDSETHSPRTTLEGDSSHEASGEIPSRVASAETTSRATSQETSSPTLSGSPEELSQGQLVGTPRSPDEVSQDSSYEEARQTLTTPPSLNSVTRSHPFETLHTPAPPSPPARAIRIQRSRQPAAEDQQIQEAWRAFHSGDLNLARTLYRQIYQANPKQIDALFGLAALAQLSGAPNDAGQYYQRILAIDPSREEARLALTTLQSNAGKRLSQLTPTQNESELKHYVAENPHQAAGWFALGTHYIQKNDWARAHNALQQALTIDPHHPDFLYNYAITLDHLSRTQDARTYYQMALESARTRPAGFDAITLALYLKKLDAMEQ
jgi:Tfp pilus assembly protein PilF